MADDTFSSAGKTYKITVYPAPADGKKYPMILFYHGNFGLGSPFGDQIRDFAKDLAGRGYLTAVPQYYEDDSPHPTDSDPDTHVPTLTDAITMVAGRSDADPDRIGLIGFSLGAATVMTYVCSNPPGLIKVLADFYGFLTPAIRAGVGKFPPTIIFHNKNDQIVPVGNSEELDRLLLSSKVEHQFVDPYDEYWKEVDHAFEPGGHADLDSQAKTTDWFNKHLPPSGR